MAVMDWSNVEFANTSSKSRKAHDLLPIMNEFLVAWDFLACVLAGQAALLLYAYYIVGKPLEFTALGPFWRDIVFGSMIAAFILRDPASLLNVRSHSLWRLIVRAEWRCVAAFTVLIAVGLATRTTDDLARLWLLAWSGLFATPTSSI